jgi:hypothetical protein
MLLESLVRKYGKNNIIKAINESHKQRITIKFIDDLINREIDTAESDDWESIIEAWNDKDYDVIDNFCEYILDTIAEETNIPDWEIREKYEKRIYNQVYKQIKKRNKPYVTEDNVEYMIGNLRNTYPEIHHTDIRSFFGGWQNGVWKFEPEWFDDIFTWVELVNAFDDWLNNEGY